MQRLLRDVVLLREAIPHSGTSEGALAAAATAGGGRRLPGGWRTVPLERLREVASLPPLQEDLHDMLMRIGMAPEIRTTEDVEIHVDFRKPSPVRSLHRHNPIGFPVPHVHTHIHQCWVVSMNCWGSTSEYY